MNMISGRGNEEIIKDSVRNSKRNISVTQDLAIAKLAMHSQAEEKPTFDKTFVKRNLNL